MLEAFDAAIDTKGLLFSYMQKVVEKKKFWLKDSYYPSPVVAWSFGHCFFSFSVPTLYPDISHGVKFPNSGA